MNYGSRRIEKERDAWDLPEGSGEGIALFIRKITSLRSGENEHPRASAFLTMAQVQ